MRVNANDILTHNSSLVNIINKDIPMPYPVRSALTKNYKALQTEVDIITKSVIDIRNMVISDDEKKTKLTELGNSEVELDIVKIQRSTLNIDGISAKDELSLEFMIEEE